jgi:hypothetical protein
MNTRLPLVAFLSTLLACSGSKDAADTDSGGADSAQDSGGPDSGGTDLECDAASDPTPAAPGCAAAGGICVGTEAQCSGALAAEHNDECRFDDGGGVCCIPPAPETSGDTCASQGGTCAPIGGCGMVDGWMADSSDCEGVNNVCCVPESSCDGQEALACCAFDEGTGTPMTRFSPRCDRGTVACFEGTTLTCIEDCAVR